MRSIEEIRGKPYAIICKTSKEWDHILELLGDSHKTIKYNASWNMYEADSCINAKDVGYANISYYRKNTTHQPIMASEFMDKDVSEIQSYLPAGHPDKAKEQETRIDFEVGKWYKDRNWSKNSYAKFSHKEITAETEKFHFSERILQGEYQKLSDWWYAYGFKSTVATLEEFQEYLPKDHPDRQLLDPLIPISKFNIGDQVYTTSKGLQYCNPQSSIKILHIPSFPGRSTEIKKKEYNTERKEWWYYLTFEGNWYNEDGLEAYIKRTSASETEYEKHTRENKHLLDKANHNYPLGSYYKCAISDATHIVEREAKFVGTSLAIDMGLGYVYFSKKWATIVETKSPVLSEGDTLLEEAKRRYPIGTIVDCVISNRNNYEVKDHMISWNSANDHSKGIFGIYSGNNTWLYHKGKWAKIKAYTGAIASTEYTDYMGITTIPPTASLGIPIHTGYLNANGINIVEDEDPFSKEIVLEKVSKASIPKFDQNKFLSEPYNQELKLEKIVRKNNLKQKVK